MAEESLRLFLENLRRSGVDFLEASGLDFGQERVFLIGGISLPGAIPLSIDLNARFIRGLEVNEGPVGIIGKWFDGDNFGFNTDERSVPEGGLERGEGAEESLGAS